MLNAKEISKSALRAVLPQTLFDRIMLAKMRWQRATFRPRIVEHAFGENPFKVWLTDPVGEDWYGHDWKQLPEIELLRQHGLKKGARVFDLGAHQGVVALMLGAEVGPTGSVIAVEANPFNAETARKNRELNSMTCVQILEAAVSDRPGTLQFSEDSNGQVDGTGKKGLIEVSARTVDSIASEFGKPDVIFLDVEGFECTALKGAQETLAARPDCFIEVHVGTGLEKFGGSIEELLSHFPESSFRTFVSGQAAGDLGFREVPRAFFSDRTQAVLRERFFLIALGKS